MAHIRANTKNGKIVSYRFTVCLGRDCNGKQIRKYTTWPIPPDTSTAKAKKAAERAADIWEQELMNEYHKKLEAESAGKAYQIPAEKRHDDFVSFVNDVWFPLQVRDGKHKHFCEQQKYFWRKVAREYPTTIIYLKDGTEKFCGYVTWNERLQEIHLRSNYHKDYEVVHYEDILLKLMLADLESGDILNIGGKRRYNILGNTDCPTPGEGGYFETIG